MLNNEFGWLKVHAQKDPSYIDLEPSPQKEKKITRFRTITTERKKEKEITDLVTISHHHNIIYLYHVL